ncbi:MAG: DUF4402 domain-containing protein [Pseudomonadota bacterium]
MTNTLKHARLTYQLALMAAAAGLGAGISAPVLAASASATATGTVVTPIAITAPANLVFGNFAPGGVAGSVTVSTGGVRSASAAILVGGTTPGAARFDITGEASATYAITHGGSAVLTSGANTMALTKVSDFTPGGSSSPSTGTLSPTGAQSLYVGGTLAVSATQAPGTYTGSVIATVEYN